MDYTVDLQRVMKQSNCLIALRDNFEDLLAKSALSILEKKIESEDIELTLKNKIFGVVVECVQNICSSGLRDGRTKDSVLVLSRLENGYKIDLGTQMSPKQEVIYTDIFKNFDSKDLTRIKEKRNVILASREDLSEAERDFLAIADIAIRSNGEVSYWVNESGDKRFSNIEVKIINN